MADMYHRWPRSYGGWQAGSVIQCEGDNCRWCEARWEIVKIWDLSRSETHVPPALAPEPDRAAKGDTEC